MREEFAVSARYLALLALSNEPEIVGGMSMNYIEYQVS